MNDDDDDLSHPFDTLSYKSMAGQRRKKEAETKAKDTDLFMITLSAGGPRIQGN